jgi:hypothetical protein
MITGSRLGDVSRQGVLGDVEVTAFDPRKTVKLVLPKVSLAFPPTNLLLEGKLSATGCGVVPLTERAKVRRQKRLQAELDDKALVMNGASIMSDQRGRIIRITSEPHACDKGIQGSDVGIEITLSADDSKMARMRVSGFSVPRPLLSKSGEEGLTISFEGEAEGNERDVSLSGEMGLAGHKLLLDGVARVEICP